MDNVPIVKMIGLSKTIERFSVVSAVLLFILSLDPISDAILPFMADECIGLLIMSLLLATGSVIIRFGDQNGEMLLILITLLWGAGVLIWVRSI